MPCCGIGRPFEPGIPPSKRDASVWMIEEKQTDVNIALHAYRDAVRGNCDQLVICSNDSDLEPALRLVKAEKSQLPHNVPTKKKPASKPSHW